MIWSLEGEVTPMEFNQHKNVFSCVYIDNKDVYL